ncbi:nitrous oxide reductase accessory protein NosL [Paucibacter sp. B51]|uniref:nitrous oxide reductase accessory protein NosL n=1 Tax=Paucibacter sp. B51 TaxID=2993315 RepID=UPI0022EC095C|nr:nitrous oxide reductase accessory protein NosL [Paucibacter sp. B51]
MALVPKPNLRRRQLLLRLGLLTAGVSAGLLARREGSEARAQADMSDFCVLAPPQPYHAGSGLGLLQPRPIPADARCPVCGMFPARSPEWAAQLIFSDGATQFFDSPVSLLIYLQDVGRYARGRSAADVAARYVRDAGGKPNQPGAWLDADQAVFVSGSDALGPMRAGNLPAFADRAAAEAFAQRRGGETLRLAEMTSALLRRLDPRAHLGH